MHTSVNALGFLPGGPVAALLALWEVVGPDGTIVVPTQTG